MRKPNQQRKNEWSVITIGQYENTARLRVQGGWLYKVVRRSVTPGVSDAVAVTFVPFHNAYPDPIDE